MADDRIVQIDAPGIAKLAAQIAAILRQDASLRQVQGEYAPQCKVIKSATVTTAAAFQFPEAQSNGVEYAFAIVFVNTSSGSGSYRIDGPIVSAGGANQFPIPSGGFTIKLRGVDAIRKFWLIPDVANSLSIVYGLFQ